MKKAVTRLTCLAASCVSLLAVAAVDVTPLTQASAALSDCATVANTIAAVPVPPDHAKAALAAATNETVTDPKQKLTIDPAHAAFAQQMKDGATQLDACGQKVRSTTKQADDFVAGLASQTNMSQEDATAVKAAYDGFEKARDAMRTAIAVLTSDSMRATYLRAPLRANFLQPPAASTGTAPRRAQQ